MRSFRACGVLCALASLQLLTACGGSEDTNNNTPLQNNSSTTPEIPESCPEGEAVFGTSCVPVNTEVFVEEFPPPGEAVPEGSAIVDMLGSVNGTFWFFMKPSEMLYQMNAQGEAAVLADFEPLEARYEVGERVIVTGGGVHVLQGTSLVKLSPDGFVAREATVFEDGIVFSGDEHIFITDGTAANSRMDPFPEFTPGATQTATGGVLLKDVSTASTFVGFLKSAFGDPMIVEMPERVYGVGVYGDMIVVSSAVDAGLGGGDIAYYFIDANTGEYTKSAERWRANPGQGAPESGARGFTTSFEPPGLLAIDGEGVRLFYEAEEARPAFIGLFEGLPIVTVNKGSGNFPKYDVLLLQESGEEVALATGLEAGASILRKFGDRLLFEVSEDEDEGISPGVWITDGTTEGTHKICETVCRDFVEVKETLFFTSDVDFFGKGQLMQLTREGTEATAALPDHDWLGLTVQNTRILSEEANAKEGIFLLLFTARHGETVAWTDGEELVVARLSDEFVGENSSGEPQIRGLSADDTPAVLDGAFYFTTSCRFCDAPREKKTFWRWTLD